MKKWKTLSNETIIEYGKFLTLQNHKIKLHNEKIIENWPWIVLPNFVNIVAITDNGKFIFFKQTKYAVDGIVLAPVGGYVEKDEEPLEAAKRELLEETGFNADEWINLGSFVVDANRGCGKGFFFLAKNSVKIAESVKDDLEEQEILFLSKDEIEKIIYNNEIKVLPWAYAILRALAFV